MEYHTKANVGFLYFLRLRLRTSTTSECRGSDENCFGESSVLRQRERQMRFRRKVK